MKYACLAVALATTWLAPPANAAKIAVSDNGSILISGRIQLGDEAHFQSSLLRLKGRGPIEVHLDTPGGSLEAAMKIAEIVRKAGLTTRVPYRAYCASACTLVFAAGVNRIANAVSRIAVHSAGKLERPGVENDYTQATTIKWARRMSSYGAPPSVVGKLVATPTDRMTPLTVADLEAWNVKIERDIPGKEISKAGSATAVPIASVPMMSPPGFDSVPRPPTVAAAQHTVFDRAIPGSTLKPAAQPPDVPREPQITTLRTRSITNDYKPSTPTRRPGDPFQWSHFPYARQ